MTLEELQEDYKKNSMNRVRFLRTLYGLPPYEVKRLLEIETPEERGMLRRMTTSDSHVAKVIDFLANVKAEVWLRKRRSTTN